MHWLILLIAGLLEICWALGLKFSNGFSEPFWTLFTFALFILSFFLFGIAIKKIPIGTAYAVFTGIGAAGTVLISMFFLNEEGGLLKVIFLSLLVAGIIGLKLTTSEEADEGDTHDLEIVTYEKRVKGS